MNPISTNKDTISLSLTNPTQALFGQLQQYIDQAEFDEALYELYHVFCDARSEDDIKQCYYILFELLPRCTSLGKLDFGVLENNLANLLNNPVFLVKEQQEQLALLLGRLYLKERKLKQAMVCFAKALQMNRSQGNYLAALEVFIHDFQSHKECRLGSFLINSTPSPDTIASHLKMLEALKAFGMPKEELLPFFQKTVRRMGSIPSEKHAAYQAHRQITRDLRDSSWELQQTPIERYWGALETFRACFANENPRTIQREAFDAMKALIALFIEDICTLIGPPPCHFDLRAMGSLGRKEMCLYSDLECMLLIADEQYRPYFIRMLELLELQIASLGETQDLPFVFTCIPNRSGFHLDSGTLNDERLMQTPIQMAEFQKRTTYIGNDIECTTLKTISLYQTTPQLYLDYQTHLQLIRKEFPFPFFDICNERIRDFSFEWKKHFNRAVFTYNIKKKFVETLYHPLSDLAVYLGIESTNTLEIAEALIDRQVLPEKMRDLLEESISLIYQIRIRNHIKHGTQNEEAHLSPEEVAILEKCYWRILVPLHTSLKKLVHSKELHRQYFEGLCQIDDPQALTKQLKGSTSILEAVLHLPDLSTTRPIYTMKIDALEASITAITEVFSPAVPGETSVQIKALHFPFTRFLRHSLAKKIMEGLDLKQEYTNSAHRVCRLQYGIHDLHFKQSPSNPLMEYAIQSLVSRIAGEYTPPTTLVRFDVEQQGQKKSYPVLISQTIPGENLKTAWPKVTPNRSYTWNLLVAILTRPQDGRISNYIFHEQDLFCVDNDLAFAEPVTRFGPFRTVHFSSAPFCLFPLTTPLDQEVLKEFVALDSVAICKAWVEEIIKKEKEYIQLFTEDERRTLYEKGDCTLTILLKKGCFSTLNFQFWQLQNVIQSAINQKEPLIVENLLKQLVNLKDEKVGDYVYRAYNSDKGTPEEKLERALERRRDTSVTCVEYHKNCLGKIPSFNEIKTLEKYSLKQAKNELFNAFLIESEHAYLKDSQGKSALGANFKELNDPNRETKILVSMNEIIKRSPKKIFSLSFYYSTVLDNRQIESFLHPDLEKIELRHCSNIDNSTVRLIQKKCPQLKELILTGCPKITELGESLFTSRLTFTHLETLEISHTPCTTLIFTAPKLRSLSISYNLALIDLDFEAPSLLQINVKKSDKIRLLPLARKYVIQTLVQTPKDLATAPLWLVNDQEIVRAILTNNGLALQYMQTEFKKDRQIVLNAVTQNGGAFQYATEELKRDREFVLAVVRKNELAFEYVSEEFKNDEEVVLTALQKSASAFKYASKELKNDRRVVLAVVQENGLALEYAFKEFKSDEEVVLAAVRKNASAFKYASEELKSDKRVVLAAVRKNASAFKYASEELKSDRVFVLAAMQQNISVFIYIDKKLKNDRQIVLAGTQKNGQCLRYASPRLKNDREIVLTAIQQDPTVLYYASEKLKNDKEFIEAAVQQNPHAFEYAYEIRYD